MQRTCNTCGCEKSLDQFARNSTKTGGYDNTCSVCNRERSRLYYRTKGGVVAKMYQSQVRKSVLRGDDPPAYSKEELKEWLFNKEDFHKLYKVWVESNFDRYEAVSCDRLDDYKGYSFDNIRVTTWKANNNKHYRDRVSGINNKTGKPVECYDRGGKLISTYHSVREAQRKTGVHNAHIIKCAKNKKNYNTAGGFVWKYAVRDAVRKIEK